MPTFIGEYPCKVDAKGRIMLPSTFKKQMPASASTAFVVKKDIFEKCLILYPLDEWQRQNDLIRQKLNPYNKEHNLFLREFNRGVAEIELDSTNRLLISKRLLETAEIKNDVVLAGMDGKIEIWAKELYEQIAPSPEDFAALAEKIMQTT